MLPTLTEPPTQTANPTLEPPPSPPEDPLTKIWYPPETAEAEIFPKVNELTFKYKGKKYGRFHLDNSNPIGFSARYKVMLEYANAFIADCYDDPDARPNSSRLSEDFHGRATNFYTESKRHDRPHNHQCSSGNTTA